MARESLKLEKMLICPFTQTHLLELKDNELAVINEKIVAGEFFFQAGIPVKFQLQKAFFSANKTYIYPVIDDILFLQKQTAIVARNRTANPLMRIADEDVDKFYEEFALPIEDEVPFSSPMEPRSEPLSLEQLKELGDLLPKSGNCFMSLATLDVDAIHNLVFGTNFEHYIHLDFSIKRLRSIKGELKQGTILILAETNRLPVATDSITSLFLFDYINNHSKNHQNEAYEELKRVLKGDGASVILYDKCKPLHAQGANSLDKAARKALSYLSSWRKQSAARLYFFPIDTSEPESGEFVPKTSLLRQFS